MLDSKFILLSQTMERSYLLKVNGMVAERPQHMLMRVSIGIHGEDLKSAIETYHCLSLKLFTHASPTLFNAGTPRNQLSRYLGFLLRIHALPGTLISACCSCFLLTMKDDSIDGIYDTLKQCAMISKSAGGIGLNVHCIRSTGTYIAGVSLYCVKSVMLELFFTFPS